MAHNDSGAMTKITVSLFAPMYADFDRQLSDLVLRRDAFIDRMISNEIPNLQADLKGKRQSSKAKRYISQCLKRMGKEQLETKCISVRHSTAAALTKAVGEHNLERDAFLNWLIALLRSSDTLLDRLGLPSRISTRNTAGAEPMPTSPMKAIAEIQWDPLYYLRNACEERFGCGLYALRVPTGLHGFACYLSDDEVPGTPEHSARKEQETRLSSALLDELDNLEAGLVPLVPTSA